MPSAFARGYIACALWCGVGDDGPEPTIDDLADDARAQLERVASDFETTNAELLAESGLPDDYAGHDFWLTRNRHGAGFWDRGLDDIGRRLTDMAHAYGESALYWGDDGRLYVYPAEG